MLPLALIGCDRPSGDAPAMSAAATATATAEGPTATASAPNAKPAPKPYEGPTGTVTGKITITGDPPPATSFRYPPECSAAAGTYGKLFRVGQDGGLADALVAVTEYKGFVPPKSEAIPITIRNCAYSVRTVALTDGQHLEVKNLDPLTSYIPHLDGARLPAGIVAVPLGDPIKLHSRGRMRYWLRDQMARDFMVAHVFHVPYSTTDVTDLSGKYSISGVPVGLAQVSVLLPQIMKRTSKEIAVVEGENVVDLELSFDAKADTPADGHGGTKPPSPGAREATPPAPPEATPEATPPAAPTGAPTGAPTVTPPPKAP